MSVDSGLLEDVVETLPAEVAILDASGDIVYTNPSWAEFGVENGLAGDPSTVGVNYLEVAETADDEHAQRAVAGVRGVLAGEEDLFTLEYPCHSPDERRWFLMYARGIEHEGDRYVHMGHMNITDRKEAELAVREKNERLETVARILRHDIRNPLAVASGYLDALAETVDDGTAAIGRIRDALDRIDTILTDAAALTHRTSLDDLESVDLATVAADAWRTVETGDATLDVVESYRFEADATVLANLFENLFRNSVDHGSTGSRPEAENSVDHGSTGSRTQSGNAVSNAEPDGTVTVGRLPDGEGFYVEDDGPGIPPERRDDVFETAFSTGDGDEHSGFGLLIVDAIADAHEWEASIAESASGGARFEFRGVTPAPST